MGGMHADDPSLGSATNDLFHILRDGQPRTRSELARITGFARSTIAAKVDALMRQGLVRPVGGAQSTGGRPATQFLFNPSGRIVLAVDVGASHVKVAISDLLGMPLAEDSAAIEVSQGPDAVLSWVETAGTALMETAGHNPRDLLAIGVGLPGPVEHSTGRPINPPIMPGWNRYDVAGRLEKHFGAPALVDNDVNIMTLGERELAWPDVDHMIFVKVATGIGSGVISGGQLQRGAQGTAGDIGHIYVSRGSDILCTCGNRGCLEAIASGPAISRALSADSHAAASSQRVIDLVREGNLEAIQAVRQAGRDIGEVLTACVSLINPSVIVIGGSMAQAGEHLIAGVREMVYSRSMPLATEHLQITQSKAGARAAILGASMLAIQYAFAPERLEDLVLSRQQRATSTNGGDGGN
jgi:predicted NBD/HSP70 family sugar kinase